MMKTRNPFCELDSLCFESFVRDLDDDEFVAVRDNFYKLRTWVEITEKYTEFYDFTFKRKTDFFRFTSKKVRHRL